MSTSSHPQDDPTGAPSEPASEATGPVDTTRTRPHYPPAPQPGRQSPGQGDDAHPAADRHETADVPARPTGVSWPTVAFGAIALAVGTLVLGLQTLDLAIDWSFVVPAAIVTVGSLLIVLGVVGLFRRRDDEAPGTP
ncbi:MAG TPA: hypothetical protein VJ976_02040 [Ornithinimicrobium sp.]|uniref:hypothetical protein n=1 Tax=Ornithinimicrobium sp. TaxID=1977084 RepID=UPI002B491099|nr:hypothetical protein [Ornithinimicrobium sp.]HKJ11149.1 hypothetical protein [Ornithinimicrobium sp.]